MNHPNSVAAIDRRETWPLDEKIAWTWAAFHICMFFVWAFGYAILYTADYSAGHWAVIIAGVYFMVCVLAMKNPLVPMWLGFWTACFLAALTSAGLVYSCFGHPYDSFVFAMFLLLGGAACALKWVLIFKRQQ